MAGFSVGGLASGIDTKSMISQLVAVERQAQLTVKRRQYNMQARAGAIGQLKTLLTNVQTAADKVDTEEEAAALTATSADVAKFTATAQGDATPGSYDIEITQLARAQKDTLKLKTSLSDTIKEQTYTISVEGEDDVDVVIDGTNNTVAGLIAGINSSDAKATASVIFDGTNYTMVLTGDETGKTVEYSSEFDKLWDGSPSVVSYQTEQSARLTVDGIAITSDSNQLASTISGVTLDLLATTESSVKLEVKADQEATVTNIKAFTDEINKLMSKITSSTKSSQDSASVLAFDSTARMLRGRIADAVIKPIAGAIGDYTSLTSVGIGMDRYGAITIDETALKEALAKDKSGVMKLITDDTDGLAKRFKVMADDFNLTDGFLTMRENMYNTRSTSLGETIARMEKRVISFEARMRKQFASLEIMIAGLQGQSAAVSRM
jgi:flagellar hook-associated protein 2